MSENFYQQDIDELLETYESDQENGLSQEEVESRLEEYGPNELDEQDQKPWYEILWQNLNNIIVYLLFGAMALSFVMGDYIEAIAIFLAILISVLTGFFVELRAAKSVDALQEMIYTTTRVLRDGKESDIDSDQVVPGDIMILKEGDAIAADGRVLDSNNFAAIESALTGESAPVEKEDDVTFDEEMALGDQVNMVFSGTAATRGSARVLVTGTGMETEVGKISDMLQGEEENQTPLDKEINQLGKLLIIVAVVAALAVVIAGLFTGQEWASVVQIAIILAVAAIPEALPAVQTITLSRGMQTMADYNALVKTLPSVETLGSTSVIASDKTGTLTENQMIVSQITLADDEFYEVTGEGYMPEGSLVYEGEELDPVEWDTSQSLEEQLDQHGRIYRIVRDAILSSNAQLEKDEESEASDQTAYSISGDPTDGALTVLGHKVGLDEDTVDELGCSRADEFAFDSANKYMAVTVDGETPHLIIKGAPDVMVEMADMDQEKIDYWEKANEQISEQGMRAIALATFPLESIGASVDEDIDDIIENLGAFEIDALFGMIDPPREDVKGSIEQTQSAGIQVKMITGDHPKTASAIAEAIGLENPEVAMTGKEIDESVDDEDFIDRLHETSVFARVSPENKLQLVEAFREDKQIVAMTGDGVNDAPALNGADIGVAMGIRGTEVAKDSSDMILTDDRFGTIVDAVEVGRVIFENIKKFVSFLFTCNMVEITTVFLAVVFLLPMPVAPLHILYLNLIIDLSPAIALSFEPAEADIMERPPRDPERGLIKASFITQVVVSGIIIGIGSFIMFNIFLSGEQSTEYIQTATFVAMGVGQLMHVLNVRHPDKFGLDRTILKNKPLIGALIVSVVLLLLAVYVPFMNTVMGTEPLRLATWGWIFLMGAVVTAINFGVKKLTHRLEGK